MIYDQFSIETIIIDLLKLIKHLLSDNLKK